MSDTVNHYYTDRCSEIFEELQVSYPQTPEGDELGRLLFESDQDIESILAKRIDRSGKFTLEEEVLFVKTVREEGI